MNKYLKIIIIIAVVVLLMAINSNVFGAINVDYYNAIKGNSVDNKDLDEKVSSSPLLDAIGILIYAVASLFEKILGWTFASVTGSNIFPWADAILFNAIPLLDPNVFNPSKASLVFMIRDVIDSVYWTIFTLAYSFLGIAIMVTAIKLAISTIASDKARYKEAIVKWITGFVMVWGIHFFMSFTLYLNEGLVKEAQVLADNQTKNLTFDLSQATGTTDKEIVEHFVTAMNNNTFSVQDGLIALGAITATVAFIIVCGPAGVTASVIAAAVSSAATVGTGYLIADKLENMTITEFVQGSYSTIQGSRSAQVEVFKSAGMEETQNWLLRDSVVEYAADLLKDSDYIKALQATAKTKLVGDVQDFSLDSENAPDMVYFLAADVYLMVENAVQINDEDNNETIEVTNFRNLLQQYILAIEELENSRRDC